MLFRSLVILLSHQELFLNGEAITLEELRHALTEPLAAEPGRAVVLKTDAGMPIQKILEVMDSIRNAGGRNVALATEGGQ